VGSGQRAYPQVSQGGQISAALATNGLYELADQKKQRRPEAWNALERGAPEPISRIDPLQDGDDKIMMAQNMAAGLPRTLRRQSLRRHAGKMKAPR
jgi:hypothetical protein